MKNKKMNRSTRKAFYGEVSKFFVDIAKLVFAGVILSGILKEDVSIVWLVICGSVAVVLSLLMAYYLFRLSKN